MASRKYKDNYIVYGKPYDKVNMTYKGTYSDIKSARRQAYKLVTGGMESASICPWGDNRQIGGVKKGDYIYERGKVFYYSDYWGKKILGLKFNKYILHSDGSLGAGKM